VSTSSYTLDGREQPCDRPIVLNKQTISDSVYFVGDPEGSTQFAMFSFTPTCIEEPLIAYSAYFLDGSSFPSFLSFDSSTRTFTYETSNSDFIGTYSLGIIAHFPDGTHDDSLTWNLHVQAPSVVNQHAPFFKYDLHT